MIDPSRLFRPFELECPSSEQVRLDREAFHGADFASTEAFIRAILPGVRDGDVVELGGCAMRTDNAYPYRIVRDGDVVANVRTDVDRIHGPGCLGTGVDAPLP